MSEANLTGPGGAFSAVASGAPVPPRERMDILDALRGVALFGILVINLRDFSGWNAMSTDARAGFATPLDRATLFLHDVLAGQEVLATVWLRYFRYGPAEWLWRRLTYQTPIPLKRVPGNRTDRTTRRIVGRRTRVGRLN